MMTNQWKEGQMRGFAVWCNAKLHERGLKIESLTELHDGVVLISLIEILSGKKIDGCVAKPENKKIVKVNNVTLALQALSDIGVPVSGISAAAFVDGDVSQTLALIWSIIQYYQLDHASFSGITGSTYNAKLLSWLKQRLQGYDFQIESLKNSFKDGLCFCALVHSYHPDALEYSKLDKSAIIENLQTAFSVAEKVMAIPRLLEPSDLSENVVDENLIVLYVSFFVKYDPGKKKDVPTPLSDMTTTTTTSTASLPATTPAASAPTSTQINTTTPRVTTTTTTTTTSPTTTTTPPGNYPTTALLRRRLLEFKDLETVPKYFFEREAIGSDDDVFFFKREAQWKRKNWSQCANLVRRAARALISLEVQPGDKVCVFGKTRYEWMAFYLAALSVGAIPVSIGSSFSSKQDITHMLNHSEASVLLLEKQSQFKKIKGLSKSLQHVKHIITREKDSGKKGLSWRQFLRRGTENVAALDEEMKKRISNLTPDTTAALVYSPGTEGDRKGIMYTHRNLLWTAHQFCDRMSITGDDSYVSFLSMSHIVEQLMTIVVPVVSGLQVYYARDITCLSDTLKESQPSVIVAPPEYWFSCYQALKTTLPPTGVEGLSEILIDQVRKSIGCGRVRAAVVGGNSQPCPLEVYTFYASLGITLAQSYGQLETTGLAALNPADPTKIRFDTVGKPIDDAVEIQIASDGEILIKGPNVFQGYYKAGELTSKALVDGWYHSGDLGKLDDGYLCFEGRRSDAIHLADGQVIMPCRLETDLRAAPLTKYAITVGEGKEHPGVLLMLDNVVAKKLAKKKGTSPKRLLNNAEVQNQIKQHVENVSKAHNVKIRRFTIYPRNLSIKKGELTYTMSMRRKHIYEHFASYIENLYTNNGTKTGGLDMVGNDEAFKRSSSLEDAKSTPKKITDGCFYRKTATGEFKKTDLKQHEIEEMERQLVLAMKEIRELAKRIKTLQEQHAEDTGLIEAKENAINMLQSQLPDSDEGEGKKAKGKGDGKKKKKGTIGPGNEKESSIQSGREKKAKKRSSHETRKDH